MTSGPGRCYKPIKHGQSGTTKGQGVAKRVRSRSTKRLQHSTGDNKTGLSFELLVAEQLSLPEISSGLIFGVTKHRRAGSRGAGTRSLYGNRALVGRIASVSKNQRRRAAWLVKTREDMNRVTQREGTDDAARRLLASRSPHLAHAVRSFEASVNFDRGKDVYDPRDNRRGMSGGSASDAVR